MSIIFESIYFGKFAPENVISSPPRRFNPVDGTKFEAEQDTSIN
jgi:hypothetical protein